MFVPLTQMQEDDGKSECDGDDEDEDDGDMDNGAIIVTL